MTRYTVELTDTAFAAIAEHARYIAIEGRAPYNAQRWLERVWDAIDSLETLPRRAAKAQEDYYVAYEVRQLVVDSHLLLFAVDDEKRSVWIVGLRHGHRRPRPDDLPPDLDALRGRDESES